MIRKKRKAMARRKMGKAGTQRHTGDYILAYHVSVNHLEAKGICIQECDDEHHKSK